MTRRLFVTLLGLVLLASLEGGLLTVSARDDDHGVRYRVTITNIIPGSGPDSGQIFNGLVVATHNPNFQLFALGEPPSGELAMIAEDALNEPLVVLMEADPNVRDVQTIGIMPPAPILPGESASVIVTAGRRDRFLSLATMLVTTNDAFVALNGVKLPTRRGEFYAFVYDAGSEANTEDCAHIPGPPCGNPEVRVVAGAEGFVSIHSGIHGIADDPMTPSVVASERDWRNPGALITVERLRGDNHD
jgi:hypothetical protein